MENLILDMLTESQRAFLHGAALDGTGGLAAELTLALVGTARKALRERYRAEPQQVALREAVTEALAAALHLWALSEEEATHYFGLFAAWLKNEAVIREFRKLLSPQDGLEPDIPLLHGRFEEEGLDAGTLLTVSFEELVQDMVGAFYEAAARKPALQEVLEVGLRQQGVGRLGALKSLEALTARLEATYRQQFIKRFETLTFRGLAQQALVLNLEAIYVELKAVADVPEGADSYSADERRLLVEAEGRGLDESELRRQLDTLRLERWREASRARSERLTRRSISETLSDPTQRGVVILGDPGSGKTTLLHYLALQAARQPVGETLPIFVPLAAYDDFIRRQQQEAPPPLGDFLALYYERTQRLPGLGPLFARALHEGRALVLLDGLDEVLDPTTRQTVAQQASALIAAESSAGNRFALTSRVVGYREAPLAGDLPHMTVLDFGPEEIATFAEQWCYTYETWAAGHESETTKRQAEQEKAALLDDVRSNPSVERLAANPLLLTMLALLRRQEGQRLPDRRVELYEKYIKTLVDNWQQVRSEGARSEAPDRFDPHEAIEHLIELALWLQQHKPSGTTPLRELESALHDSCLRLLGHKEPERAPAKAQLEATQRAESFIRDMRHFAGLLAERGQDAFGFLHLTFQEYFAGRALARMEPERRWDTLRGNLHNPRWREPLLLCAGQLGIVEHRCDQVSDLAARVLEAGSEYEGLLHRDLFLAAAIAADDVGLAPALLDRLCDQLIPLQQSNIPTVRDSALSALARLARIGHAPAIAALHESLADESLRAATIRAISPVLQAEACAPFQKPLLSALSDSEWDVRAAAVTALGALAATHTPVRDALLSALSDSKWDVRAAAVTALGALAATHTPVRDALLSALSAREWDVRAAAVTALGALAATHTSVRDALLSALSASWYTVRAAAVAALAGLASSHPPTHDALLFALRDSNVNVRAAAVAALGGLAATQTPVRDALLSALSDSEYPVRAAAVTALGGLAATQPAVRDALLSALSDSWDGVRAAAVTALGGLAATQPAVRDALLSALSDSWDDMRAAAVTALGGLAATQPAVRDALLSALSDSHSNVRVAAVEALAGLTSSHPATHSARFLALRDTTYPMRAAAVEALAGLAGSHPPTHAALLHALHDSRDDDVRVAVVRALAGLASSHPPSHDALLHTLQHSDKDRAAAVEALVGLASSHPPTHAALLLALRDREGYVRRAAVEALAGQIGAEAGTTHLLVTWLGFVAEGYDDYEDEWVRRLLAERYAPLLAEDTALRAQVSAMLDSPAWPARQGAAMALIAMPGGPPPELLPKLTGLLDDLRGEESWPGRLTIAALFVNDRDAALSQEAIAAALEALDVATQPWCDLWHLGQQVRAQAAQILGTLEPLYRDDAIFARLRRVLDEDEDESVRDTAFGALLRLAAAPERR